MAKESRLKGFWKYLHTSHGTHRVVTYVDDGYSCTPEPSVVPNKTPLQKIVLTAIGASILVLSYGVVDYVRNEERKKRDRMIPAPVYLEVIESIYPHPEAIAKELGEIKEEYR